MHITAKLPHCVQFRVVEHLTECLEFILGLLLFFMALFLIEHAPESLEIGAILYEAGDVDLRSNEVA
jgi:hypothetical protein